MSKVKFTEQQQQFLRDNPFSIRVTQNSLSLSKEFKKIFYEEYQSGAMPREILKKYGYPIEILGKQRVWGITNCINKEYVKSKEFTDIRTPKQPTSNCNYKSIDDPVKRLQHQVDYLTQEVEFFKKISSIKNIGK